MVMAQTSRTFRIFVSSTFTDLKEERNALQEQVFPKLRDLCLQHGCRFQAIDLRWGVSEEAALDQRTMQICLEEIARCQRVTPRPNFLVLLGDRYGWRPLPAAIPEGEFAQIQQRVPSAQAHTLLDAWYQRDDNAVPPAYCLQPRTGEFIDPEVWEKQVERPLRSLLVEATAGMELTPAARVKYLTSATEQEIEQGTLHVSTAQEQVFCCLRTITNLEQLIASAQEHKGARQFIDLDEQGRLDQEVRARLGDLKERLSRSLPGSIHTYEAEWTGSSGLSTDHLGTLPDTLEACLALTEEEQAPSTLCVEVWRRLSRVILEEIARLEEADALEREVMAHNAFGEARANPQFFTGRTAILHTIGAYVHSATRHPLVVFGASGSGKSALLARAVAQLCDAKPEAVVVVRFIGATPESSDGRALLEGLCRQIARHYGTDEASIPTDYPHLVEAFPQQLALTTAERPLLVVLDALDQLSDREGARQLAWLPAELPEHVRLLVSTIPGDCLEALQRKLPAECLVPLQPMAVAEGAQVLERWLSDAGRTLQEPQREQVLDAFGKNGLPLYLKLAFEEARRWTSFTPVEETVLKEDIPGVIRDLFARLGREENHSQLLVARSLGFLAAAKNGLTEDELLDVLSHDADVRADFQRRSPHSPKVDWLPVVVWSRLYFDLEPYLSERLADGTSVLSFYHRQLGEVVQQEYLAGDAPVERHAALAHYFALQQLASADKQTANLRMLSELPYQQTHGQLWPELEETTLCNLRFVEAKCAAGLVYDLQADYDRALAALPEAQPELARQRRQQQAVADYTQDLIAYARAWNEARLQYASDPARYPLPPPEAIALPTLESVRLWTDEELQADTERIIGSPTRLDRLRAFAAFVRAEIHHLVQFATLPGFCVQQAYNSADSGPVVSAAEQLLQTDRRAALLLQPPTQRAVYTPHPALLRTLEGHSARVSSVSVTPDGQTAVSGSHDETVRVWDLTSGKVRHTMAGHTDVVNCVSVTPDGQTAVSGSWDGTVRVWELARGQCRHTLQGHRDRVNSVSLTPDGQIAVSGSDDYTVRVWDLVSGKVRHTMAGHAGPVDCVSVTADGRTAVSTSLDGTARVWDLTSGELCHTKGYTGAVSVTPDGQTAVSGSHDETVRVWDLTSGKVRHTMAGHTDVVNCVSVTADGRTAVSGSPDETVRVWDLVSGQCRRTMEGHAGTVSCVSVTADGRTAVSGGGHPDNTVRVWELASGQCRHTLQGHNSGVNCVSLTPDGRTAVSGSWGGTVRVWDLTSGEVRHMLEGHTEGVVSASLTPDGQTAISGSRDRTVRVWDLVSGECRHTLQGHRDGVTSVSVTPDGQTAVSGSWDGTVRVWDLVSGQCRYTLEHTRPVSSVSLTPDGTTAVSGSSDDTVRVWDLTSGKLRHTLKGHTGLGSVLADGRIAVSGSDDHVCVWDLTSGECRYSLKGHTGIVYSVSVTADGRTAVSGSFDDTVRVWDLTSGKLRHTLKGHTGLVTSVSLTPDGQTAISGSVDPTVRVWDLATGQQLAIFPAPSAPDGLRALSEIRADGQVGFGVASGQVVFVTLQNVRFAPPLMTVVRLWLSGAGRARGRWDDKLTTHCAHCGQRFVPPPHVLDTIHRLTAHLASNDSPCLELSPEAWNEPGLLSACPHCHQPVRFNPFVLDQRDRVRRATAKKVSAGPIPSSPPLVTPAPEGEI